MGTKKSGSSNSITNMMSKEGTDAILLNGKWHISGVNENGETGTPLLRLTDTKLGKTIYIDNGEDGDGFRVLSDAAIELQSSANTKQLKLTKTGYIYFGPDMPSIKFKKLTVTLGSVGAVTTVEHGVTRSKILSVSMMVTSTGGYRYPPVASASDASDYYYWYRIDDTNINITLGSSASVIAGRSLEMIIIYEE